jgi:hypothetical protein
MKYLVNMVDPRGKRKNVILEASSCKEATNLASDKYINYEVVRVSADAGEIGYFDAVKKYKG